MRQSAVWAVLSFKAVNPAKSSSVKSGCSKSASAWAPTSKIRSSMGLPTESATTFTYSSWI